MPAHLKSATFLTGSMETTGYRYIVRRFPVVSRHGTTRPTTFVAAALQAELTEFPTAAVARKGRFVATSQADLGRPVLVAKIFRFTRRANHLYKFAPSYPTRGAYRDRHGRGEGCGGRGSVLRAMDCRAGWRKARERSQACGREMLLRTAKSCGPDAPTLASSSRMLCRPLPGAGKTLIRWRRWQKSPVTGESSKETVKTIACGNVG